LDFLLSLYCSDCTGERSQHEPGGGNLAKDAGRSDLHCLAERFVDWDGTFQTWLVEHFMLVRRTMGIDKSVRALDGFPTAALSGPDDETAVPRVVERARRDDARLVARGRVRPGRAALPL
jgi:hypothetical protein